MKIPVLFLLPMSVYKRGLHMQQEALRTMMLIPYYQPTHTPLVAGHQLDGRLQYPQFQFHDENTYQ
jgi:hypothetical protein